MKAFDFLLIASTLIAHAQYSSADADTGEYPIHRLGTHPQKRSGNYFIRKRLKQNR